MTPAKFRAAASTVYEWIGDHPRTVHATGWIALGFTLGLLAGCAAFDFAYWCLRSAPGKGGPFCP